MCISVNKYNQNSMEWRKMKSEDLIAICEVLANNLSHSQINKLLGECAIKNMGQETKKTDFGYIPGDNKKNKLLKSFRKVDDQYVYIFIQKVVDPVLYTDMTKRGKYNELVEALNRILLFDGKEINSQGKIIVSQKVTTLREVDIRVNNLKKQFYGRKIHPEVAKYCDHELLKKDYYEAVFEATKGLAERVRAITGLTTDGTELFQIAFSTKDPYIFFNSLKTKSELNEHNGLNELLCAIFHLVRNPQAHTPKMNWTVDEDKALDILSLISFAHKYLDLCNKMPGK